MLAIFNKLLLAVDLTPDSDQLLNRVLKICRDHMARVHVVHVLPDDGSLPGDGTLNLRDPEQKRLRDRAVIKLNEILHRNGFEVSWGNIHVRAGEPANEIKRLAHHLEADLVIVGSHNKNGGWLSLPGATTNCVLQGIETDVMAVRVQPSLPSTSTRLSIK